MQTVEWIVVEAWPPGAGKPENCGIIIVPSGEKRVFCQLRAEIIGGDMELQEVYREMAAQLMTELSGNSAIETLGFLESTASNFLRFSARQSRTLQDGNSIASLLQELYESETVGGAALAARAG